MRLPALLLFFFMLSCSAFGSPWGRERGSFFLAPQFYYYEADEYWDRNGSKKSLDDTFRKREFALYGEYGIDGRNTLTFRLPYQHLDSGKETESGLADLEVGLITSLKREGRGVVSSYLVLILPTGYSTDESLRLGYGRWGAEASLLGGYGGDSYFLEGGLGYRFYSGYPSDQIRGYGRVGLKAGRFTFIDTLELHYGLNNGEERFVGNITLEPYYRLLQNDLNIVYRVNDGLAVSVGFVKALWGRNTGDGESFYGQVWFRF